MPPMDTAALAYDLPPEAIAQTPVEPRDAARLLIDEGVGASPRHGHITDLVGLVGRGDVVVINTTRVLPARLRLRKDTGGSVEVLLLEPVEADAAHRWEALVRPSRKVPPGTVLQVADGLPSVEGDPDKVGRVLINLVDNAVKYSPDGGRVQVTVGLVGSHVRFSVADQGLGVPPGEQRRIFEKFYRLDPNMNRGVGGTGLGLYICRELVRRMEGRIWVDSAGVGNGSTFHIELPVAGDFTAHLREI